jgi:plastocyanin
MQRWILTITAVGALASALVAAGCGGESDAPEGEAAPAGETIRVTATEFAFEPATVRVDAPGTYRFLVANEGEAPHALAIEGPGVDEVSATVGGGETAEVTVEITEPGEYRIFCPVGGHAEQGMTGTLVAEAP